MAEELLETWKDENYLFKYRDWTEENHRLILTEKALYLPEPQSLGDDTNDCRLREVIPNKENWAVSGFADLWGACGVEGAGKWILAYQTYQESALSEDDCEEQFQKNVWEPMLEKKVGVLCLSKQCDSDYLWEHYAKGHQGFCLVLDSTDFTQAWKTPHLFSMTGDVQYCDPLPELKLNDWSDENTRRRLFTKHNSYKEECEYRCIRFLLNKKWTRHAPIADSLRGIILGRNMPKEHEEELRETVKRYWADGNIEIVKL